MTPRRIARAFTIGLLLGAPAVAQDWPAPREDADLVAASTWLRAEDEEAAPRFALRTTEVAGHRLEVEHDRARGASTVRAVRADGRRVWSFPASGDPQERIEVVHIGAAERELTSTGATGGWSADPAAAGAACVVLRADRGGHAGGTAIVLAITPGHVAELARVDLGSGGLEVLARHDDPAAPPDLRTRDEAFVSLAASSADAPRALLRWRWVEAPGVDGPGYACVAVDEPTSLPASAGEPGDSPAARLSRITTALYRGDASRAAAMLGSVPPGGAIGGLVVGSTASAWSTLVARMRGGPAWPALVRATPALALLPDDLEGLDEEP